MSNTVSSVYEVHNVFYKSHRVEVANLDGDGKNESFIVPGYTGKIIFSNKYTIVILDDMYKGVAKCCPSDKFSRSTGLRLAYNRALIKKLQDETENHG